MSSVLAALEAAVDRFGPRVLGDPIALAAALSAGDDSPSGAEIAALVGATPAVDRLRHADADDPQAALEAAVRVVDPDSAPGAPGPARWACALLGAALGVLPAELAGEQGRPPAAPDPAATGSSTATGAAPTGDPPPLRRSRQQAVLVAVAVAAVSIAGAVLVGAGVRAAGGPAPSAPAASPARPGPAAGAEDAGTGPFAGDPADPRSAFTDPWLLAVAEPYISRPGVRCERESEPRIGHREQVSCDLGDQYLGFFQSMFTPAGIRAVRNGYLRAEGGQLVAQTVRSLRWKQLSGRPGTKAGIPRGDRDRGDGVRVRFLDPDGGKWLYFDVDGGLQYALLATLDPARTPDDLRRFWADPDR